MIQMISAGFACTGTVSFHRLLSSINTTELEHLHTWIIYIVALILFHSAICATNVHDD